MRLHSPTLCSLYLPNPGLKTCFQDWWTFSLMITTTIMWLIVQLPIQSLLSLFFLQLGASKCRSKASLSFYGAAHSIHFPTAATHPLSACLPTNELSSMFSAGRSSAAHQSWIEVLRDFIMTCDSEKPVDVPDGWKVLKKRRNRCTSLRASRVMMWCEAMSSAWKGPKYTAWVVVVESNEAGTLRWPDFWHGNNISVQQAV